MSPTSKSSLELETYRVAQVYSVFKGVIFCDILLNAKKLGHKT